MINNRKNNKKKNKKKKKNTVIIPYTKEGREQQINQIKLKLSCIETGTIILGNKEINKVFNEFIEYSKEFTGSIPISNTNYIAYITLINNCKKTAELYLKCVN